MLETKNKFKHENLLIVYLSLFLFLTHFFISNYKKYKLFIIFRLNLERKMK